MEDIHFLEALYYYCETSLQNQVPETCPKCRLDVMTDGIKRDNKHHIKYYSSDVNIHFFHMDACLCVCVCVGSICMYVCVCSCLVCFLHGS